MSVVSLRTVRMGLGFVALLSVFALVGCGEKAADKPSTTNAADAAKNGVSTSAAGSPSTVQKPAMDPSK